MTPDDRRTAIIDASNVVNSAPSAKGRLEYLRLVVDRVRSAGLEPLVIADDRLERRLDRPDDYRAMVAAGEVRVAAPGTEADELILQLAAELSAVVVSNDRFREWRDRFPGASDRRVGFRVRDGVAELRGLE